MLQTRTSACAGGAPAFGPGALVAQARGRAVPATSGVRAWAGSRRDANDRGSERGLWPSAPGFEAIDRPAAHPRYAKDDSAGGRDRAS